MFGNLGELANIMKKAKDIQKNMAALKEEMAKTEFSAASADREVVAVVSGDFRVKSIVIDPAAAGKENISALVTFAVNAALDAAKSAMQSKMQELSGGLNIPGLF